MSISVERSEARRNVWDRLFGLVNASTPDPWKRMMECTTAQYGQMVASILEGQAAAIAGREGVPRTVGTAAEVQPKTGRTSSKTLTGQTLLETERASTSTPSVITGATVSR